MRFAPIALFLALVSVFQVARAEAPGEVSQLEASVRAIINEHCGSCHDGALSTAKPAARKIFDLREGDWTARMSDDQLTTVVGRVKGKNLPTRQQAQVSQLMEQKREERATRAVPPSGPALSQLEYFVGEWQCQGKHFQTEFSPASSGSAAVEIKPALQGAWYSVRVQTPKGYEGAGFWGRDAAAREFVMIFVRVCERWSVRRLPGPTVATSHRRARVRSTGTRWRNARCSRSGRPAHSFARSSCWRETGNGPRCPRRLAEGNGIRQSRWEAWP